MSPPASPGRSSGSTIDTCGRASGGSGAGTRTPKSSLTSEPGVTGMMRVTSVVSVEPGGSVYSATLIARSPGGTAAR